MDGLSVPAVVERRQGRRAASGSDVLRRFYPLIICRVRFIRMIQIWQANAEMAEKIVLLPAPHPAIFCHQPQGGLPPLSGRLILQGRQPAQTPPREACLHTSSWPRSSPAGERDCDRPPSRCGGSIRRLQGCWDQKNSDGKNPSGPRPPCLPHLVSGR